MTTEEKIKVNSETVEPAKPRRRFRLDKKHLQGFIAGILVTSIAFTGLYYGTEGLFFKGTVNNGNRYVVTDKIFEEVVINSDIQVLGLFIQGDRVSLELDRIATFGAYHYEGYTKFAVINVRNAPKVHAQYSVSSPTVILFRNGEIYDRWDGLTLNDLLYFDRWIP